MSILIKGMKMPTDKVLTINVWADGNVYILGENPMMLHDAAIELPDHGDLIDIEVLRNLTGMRTNCSACNHFGVFGCKGDISTDYICGVIDDIPAVIPAERSEDERTD